MIDLIEMIKNAPLTFAMYGIFTVLCIVPLVLFYIQWKLSRKDSKAALILPTVVACFFPLFGTHFLFVSGILFLIYYITTKNLKEQVSELHKMNIEDL